jgi:acyl-CoA reductase-like NAD-dependent aldehyde dehydrogenase
MWAERARTIEIAPRQLIAGQLAPALSGETLELLSPIDGRSIGNVASGSGRDVDAAVRSARGTFEGGDWARRAPRERKAVLTRLSALIDEHRDEIALLDTLSMGMPIALSRGFCVQWAVDAFRWYGEAIDKVYDEIAPTAEAVLALIRREPVGVVGAVLPWNWPTGLLAWKVAPALAAGNSVVVKPDEKTSASALRIGELALEAGLPPGVLNVVTGGAGVGEAIGRHMDIDVVTFTGSGEVGRMFQVYAGQSNMKAVWLECGGKGPNIILDDAGDPQAVAGAAAGAIFANGGQICAAGSRLLVQHSVKDAVLAHLREIAIRFGPHDPFEETTWLGPLASEAQLARVQSYVEQGRAEGARLAVGGQRVLTDTGGCYLQPTIFEDVSATMSIAREEIFGPVLAVMSFHSDDEALALANSVNLGLSGAVWTQNLGRAHRLAAGLRCGSVCINAYAEDAHNIEVPFGGYKQSGFGRDKSLHALDKYQQLKTIWARHA